MKTKVRYLTIFFTCSVMVLIVSQGFALGRENRPTISAAERALAMWEVQNTMSKHGYYHAVEKHIEELNTCWVKQDGPYAKTAKWTQPGGVWEGMELIMSYYGIANIEAQKKDLEEINKIYPEIKVVPENYGLGTWGVNTPTNPVIEIAGDGKTAKGMWESNGPILSSSAEDGKMVVHGTWYWRKYAVDFVKEDGQWKIWHMNIVYDIATPIDAEYGMDYTKYRPPEMSGGGGGPSNLPAPTRPNPNPYEVWSPTRSPKIQPKLPEPYYTFSETFSY